jgi:metal-sulfur cluster biosynthetic enzyme
MTMLSVETIRAALREVQDPELPVDVVSLGLVRSIELEGSEVTVGLTFTSLACPCTDVLIEDVASRLLEVDGVTSVAVQEVFEPWSMEDMTEDARLALRTLAII